MTFAEFVAQRGAQAVAEACGQPVQTAHLWKHRNAIPRRYWPKIMAAFPDVGAAEILEMDQASRTKG